MATKRLTADQKAKLQAEKSALKAAETLCGFLTKSGPCLSKGETGPFPTFTNLNDPMSVWFVMPCKKHAKEIRTVRDEMMENGFLERSRSEIKIREFQAWVEKRFAKPQALAVKINV